MLNVKGIQNYVLGFTPYKAGDKTAWIKSSTDNNGYRRIFKKLPTGTVIKDTLNPSGELLKRRILKNNGVEIKAFTKDSATNQRTIFFADAKNKVSKTIRTNGYYDAIKDKYIHNTQHFEYEKLFGFVEKLKMHLGMK